MPANIRVSVALKGHATRLTVVIAILGLSTGCTMCCTPFLDDYVTVGGKHPRSDMTYGRVGSVFSDPEMMQYESPVIAIEPDLEALQPIADETSMQLSP